MPLPIIADTIRCSVEGTMPNGNHWANILHVRSTGALTPAAAIVIADPKIFALWNTALGGGSPIKQYMNTQWTMQRIRYTPLDGVSATTVISHSLAGSQVGDPLPANVALCMTLYTAMRGRRHRGRTYFGGWDELTNKTIGVMDPVYVATLNTQAIGWLASFVGSGLMPVVASYGHYTKRDGTIVTFAPSAADVISAVWNGTWDSQRRRNRP